MTSITKLALHNNIINDEGICTLTNITDLYIQDKIPEKIRNIPNCDGFFSARYYYMHRDKSINNYNISSDCLEKLPNLEILTCDYGNVNWRRLPKLKRIRSHQ